MNRLIVLGTLLALSIVSAHSAQDALAQNPAQQIGYIEDFALAADREQALEQLIPGTEDYYYYTALHLQNTEQFEKVEALLKQWIARYKYTPRVNEIRNRQALLTYAKNPDASLEFIRQQLGIQFNHQREFLGRKPNLPTTLDQKLISRETLKARALANYSNNFNGFEDSALEWLTDEKWEGDRRRNLLQRLQRPDYPNLPEVIVADLNYRYSGGFGSIEIHKRLLKSQLDELLKLKADLREQTNFVNVYLTKLHPNDDVDWRHDDEAYEAYLARLWDFVETLPPAFNSLKGHVLYHQLVLDRRQGEYDKERFMTYIKLPKYVSYINNEYMKLDANRRHPCDLSANFQPFTLLPVVGADEPLVRSYLHHFFVKEADYKPYQTYINDNYLKHNFAEVKIVHGLGEPEQWYSLLPPAKYQALKERIDLDFAYTNARDFGVGDKVSLDVDVKNVETLIVKVFQINTQNFYRENLREIDTDINLDGLVANQEKTHKYEEPPLRRVRRHFEFPEIKCPGVWVIDFIGNGKSSRALVRKGRLHALVRTGSAGQVFTVLDRDNNRVKDATLWLAGHEYTADKEGEITVPFTNQPARQAIVLSRGEFSSLAYFQHEAESYNLAAGIYVDREQLLERREAELVIRPSLTVSGTPTSLSVLEEVKLTITSTDLDGVSTSKEIDDFKLFEDRESTYELKTPQRVASLQVALTAKVQNLSQNKKQTLSTGETFTLNQIDRTEKTHDLHLLHTSDGYAVDVLGKTGEPVADHPIQVSLKHRDFRQPANTTLRTDAAGRIELGALKDITAVTVSGPEGTSRTWQLLTDRHSHYSNVNGRAGQPVVIPFMTDAERPQRDELSLLEMHGGQYVADRFEALSLKNGLLTIADLPRGDYSLLLKPSGTHIHIRLTEGPERDDYVLGKTRLLEVRGQKPLQIASVKTEDEQITVQLANATKFARVHVFAARYEPAYQAYPALARVGDVEPYRVNPPYAESLYVEGRNIGDEYRYIIDRKYAEKYPGVMLQRPSLLLNPWAIRSTETGQQLAQQGDAFGAEGKDSGGQAGRDARQRATQQNPSDFADLDFLAETSAVLLNVEADEKGVVTIPRDLLKGKQHVRVVAVDPTTTAYRVVELPESKPEKLDLRLVSALDAEKHYTQQKQISIVSAKGKFELPDVTTSRFEAYDNLARVYGLYATLSGDSKLIEFSFILGWPELEQAKKEELYSKYACHELNFFLYKKDPKFFQDVVQPYLANKRDKTFLDHWLLEQNLKAYLTPWQYARLNTVERILLSQRIAGEQEYTARDVQDLFDLIPFDPDRYAYLFNTAVKGSALDTGDALGFDRAKEVAEQQLAELESKLDGLHAADRLHLQNRASSTEAAPGFAGGPSGGRAMPSAPRAAAPPADEPAKTRKAAEKADAKYESDAAGERLARRRMDSDKDGDAFFDEEDARRANARQFYQKLDKTKEWVENNYYHLPIEQQNAELVTVNGFWRDFATADAEQPFYSTSLAEASRSFPEMMFALAVLDLPFTSPEHKTEFEEKEMTLTAGGPMVVYHEEIRPAELAGEKTPILVSQNYFRRDDRYRYEGNERLDKFVRDEFLRHTVYGAQVVVTNPTSSPQKLNLLIQIPEGSMPVLGAEATTTKNINLGAFSTQTVEFYFYFPAAGDFPLYPVQVAKNEELIAFAEAFTFHVVEEATKIDTTSWAYISQHGSDAEVVTYLNNHNLHRIELAKIAFRMQDKAYFNKVTDLLAQRHLYDHTLWSYGIKHDEPPEIQQYLRHADGFVAQCGMYLDSPLLVIDPVERKTYQHRDYKPLVNARAHQLGRRRTILNDRLHGQYHDLLKILSYRRALDDDDRMSVTYYMLLQDRIGEALETFAQVEPEHLQTRLQYDYFTAHLALYTGDVETSRETAEPYLDYPVERWKETFVALDKQLDEITDAPVEVVDDESREQRQTQLASTEPSFEFHVESKQVKLDYQNLEQVEVNYYLMDVELLFSRNPFVKQQSGQFSYIRPNLTEVVKLPAEERSHTFALPAELHTSNVLVEITGGGQTKQQAYYAHSLTAQVIESYGQVRVTEAATGKPLPKTYVKVYAQNQDGSVKFYKDGYTDLRGRFDYTSLNTNELDFVGKFSLLVLSDTHGAVVREASPPKR